MDVVDLIACSIVHYHHKYMRFTHNKVQPELWKIKHFSINMMHFQLMRSSTIKQIFNWSTHECTRI